MSQRSDDLENKFSMLQQSDNKYDINFIFMFKDHIEIKNKVIDIINHTNPSLGNIKFNNQKPKININISDLTKKIYNKLNKLSDKNFNIIVEKINKIEINDFDSLKELVNLICEKAYNEPNCFTLYCRLLENLNDKKINKEGKIIYFKQLVLDKCRINLLEDHDINKNISNNITDERYATFGEYDIIELKNKRKKRYVGIINFIVEMYKQNYINSNSIDQTIDNLFKFYNDSLNNDIYIEYICEMLINTHQNFGERNDTKIISWINKLNEISKTKITPKIRFKITDVAELYVKIMNYVKNN